MSSADWRSPIAYESLDIVPSRALAWEYLRRNPDYARDFARADTVSRMTADAIALTWGLRFRGRSALSRPRRAGLLVGSRGHGRPNPGGTPAWLYSDLDGAAAEAVR